MRKFYGMIGLALFAVTAVIGDELDDAADSSPSAANAWPAGPSVEGYFAGRPWYGELIAALAADPPAAENTARQLAGRHDDDRLVLEAIADWIGCDFAPVPPRPPYVLIPAGASHVQGSLEALCDGRVPKNSDDHSIPRFTWWARKGSREWVQYDFPEPRQVSGIEVYWFDDRPRGGGCRVPQSWELLYLNGREWKPVEGAGP
jgi:hypothetical protein